MYRDRNSSAIDYFLSRYREDGERVTRPALEIRGRSLLSRMSSLLYRNALSWRFLYRGIYLYILICQETKHAEIMNSAKIINSMMHRIAEADSWYCANYDVSVTYLFTRQFLHWSQPKCARNVYPVMQIFTVYPQNSEFPHGARARALGGFFTRSLDEFKVQTLSCFTQARSSLPSFANSVVSSKFAILCCSSASITISARRNDI